MIPTLRAEGLALCIPEVSSMLTSVWDMQAITGRCYPYVKCINKNGPFKELLEHSVYRLKLLMRLEKTR